MSAKRNRCINATPFIGREKAGEIDATKVDQVLYAHFKVGVFSSESFLFQNICHCLSNDHDFTLISQTEYTLFRRFRKWVKHYSMTFIFPIFLYIPPLVDVYRHPLLIELDLGCSFNV